MRTTRPAILHGPAISPDSVNDTLSQSLLRAARDFPSHGIIFVNSTGEEDFLSFPQLERKSRQCLFALASLGLVAGDKVILEIDEPKQFYFAFWACIFGGLIPTPISQPASYSASGIGIQKLRNVWLALGRPIIIMSERNRAKYEGLKLDAVFAGIDFYSTNDLVSSQVGNVHPAMPGDIVLLQYSSGSTGHPKGIMLSNTNVHMMNLAMTRGIQVTSADISCSWLPHTHDMGLIGQHIAPIFNGVTLVQFSPSTFVRSPLLFLNKVDEHRATIVCCPNFGLDWMSRRITDKQASQLDLSSLRVIFNGAEPISVAVIRHFTEKFARSRFNPTAMFPVYGMAEATLAVSFPALGSLPFITRISRSWSAEGRELIRLAGADEHADAEIVSEGMPVVDMAIRIADAAGGILMENSTGEIQIRGGAVTKGYYDNPEANLASFEDGWFKTGDAGFISEGRLFVSGRIKDILFVRGRNYYSHDIEELIYAYQEIPRGNLAVLGLFNPACEKEEILVFAKHKGDMMDFLPIRDKVTKQLAATLGLEVSYVIPVSSIPKTTSGKVQRYLLRANYEKGEFADNIKELASLQLPERPTTEGADEELTELQGKIRQIWSLLLCIDEQAIDIDGEFLAMGGNSIKAFQLLSALERLTNSVIDHEILITCKTIRQIECFLQSEASPKANLDEQKVLAIPRQATERDMAITGLAVRFPQADTIDQFWANLCAGNARIAPVSDKRKRLTDNNEWDDWMGELEGIDLFDNKFFQISAEDAKFMDPQQRLILEVSYECLEDAGLSESLDQESNVGVYTGISSNSYSELVLKRLKKEGPEGISPGTMTGNMINIIAARVSHMFNFTGPSISIDTACSSFMVSMHEAVHALRRGQIAGALVASANLLVTSTTHALARKAGILSKVNRCRVFDRDADGTTLGEGVIVAYIEPLANAVKQRKHIYGVVKGVAVNNDGYSLGLMAPNPRGQLNVLRSAYRDANISPALISYIEAHGTGTVLGDPIELRALSNFFAQAEARLPCGIGSVKSSLGHLLHAAGGAGVAKTLLCLEKRTKVPTSGLDNLNPSLEMEKSPFRVVRELERWDVTPGQTRKAGVSSFGFGGTNAHVVLEEYIDPAEPQTRAIERDVQILTFSAKSDKSLKTLIGETFAWIGRHSNIHPNNICFTRNRFRKHFPHRAAFVFRNTAELNLSGHSRNSAIAIAGYSDKRRAKITILVGADAGSDIPRAETQPGADRVDDECAKCSHLSIFQALSATLQTMGVSIDSAILLTSGRILPPAAEGDEIFKATTVVESDYLSVLGTLRPDIIVVLGVTRKQIEDVEGYFKQRQVSVVVADPTQEGISQKSILSLIGHLYVRGARIAWETIYPDGNSSIVSLPGYAFDRASFWID